MRTTPNDPQAGGAVRSFPGLLSGSRETARLPRPHLGALQLAAAIALILTGLHNTRFWSELLRLRGPLDLRDVLFCGSVSLLMFLAINLLLTLVSFPYLLKAVSVPLLIVSSIVDHFMTRYHVVIDATMMQNVFETDAGEVGELISGSLVSHVLLAGVLPSALVLLVKLRPARWRRALVRRLAVVSGSVVGLLSLVATMYPDYASFFPQHHRLGQLATPTNVLYATQQYLRTAWRPSVGPLRPVGLDARVATPVAAQERKNVLLLIVGETARASEFSLNGYSRKTNPELERESAVSFLDVQACGTSTSTSIPCMFSPLGRESYDGRKAGAREGLLDVLDHAGVDVLWRENNSGCKGACDRVRTETSEEFAAEEHCRSGECLDEALLDGLDTLLDHVERHTVIVLHQKGSHGPAYHKRHPRSYRRFVPECEAADLRECSREQVVNAYDNTILYTDHVLGRAIDLLERHEDRLNTAMLYVSDHGESLGEHNIYLHGLPYALAPSEQRSVPLIVWISPRFTSAGGLDRRCIADERNRRLSHDNLFHSVLGVMSVETSVYERDLDLFAPCRDQATVERSPGERKDRG